MTSGITSPRHPAPDLTVLLPAYREVVGVGAVVRRIREVLDASSWTYEILVVDDGSDDGTATAATAAGARVLVLPANLGNGAAAKAGIREARGRYCCLLDADGQHPPEGIPRLLEHLPTYDMVVAARTPDSPQQLHRRAANWVFNRFSSYIVSYPIEDLTSGFRVFKTQIARQYLTLLPNRYSYPTTITLAIIRGGYAVKYVPVRTTVPLGRSTLRPVENGVRFLLVLFKIAANFEPGRVLLPVSAFLATLGLGYGAWSIGRHRQFSNGALLLLLMGVFTFLLALVAQKLSTVRSASRSARPGITSPRSRTAR